MEYSLYFKILHDLDAVVFFLKNHEESAARKYFNEVVFKKYNVMLHEKNETIGSGASFFYYDMDTYFNNEFMKEKSGITKEELVAGFADLVSEYESMTNKKFVHITEPDEVAS